MPNSARQTRKLDNVGASAEASSNAEKAMTLTMSVGRRPYFSAMEPKRNAPTGRMARVQKMASSACLRPVWKVTAMAVRQKVSRKKSKASRVQPRKQAEKVLRWTRVRERKWPAKGIAESWNLDRPRS